MAVKVGSFAKSTGAAPVDQAITGVDFMPKAVVFWTAGATANGWADACQMAYGFTSGATESFSIAFAADDNVATSNTGKRQAAKALTICSSTPTEVAECDLKTFDADGFTVTWTTNDASATIVHYMALSGANLSNAKAISWIAGTTVENHSVTGVGFQPDFVLSISQFNTSAPANNSTGANTEAIFSLGAMTAADQWVVGYGSWDGKAAGTVYRSSNQSLFCLGFTNTSSDYHRLEYVSMDADGFTYNVVENASSAAYYVFSLCLKGGSYDIDGVTKSTGAAPASQSVTGIAFEPEGIFMAAAAITAESTSGQANGRLAMGASDGTTEGCVALEDDHGADPTNNARFDSVSKILSYGDNDTQTTDNAADLSSLDSNGFTLNWTTNDADADWLYYMAFSFGSAAAGQPIALRDWVRHTGRPWRPQRGL